MRELLNYLKTIKGLIGQLEVGGGGSSEPVIITGETTVISSETVTQTRTSINLLNIDDAGWLDGFQIPFGAGDPNLALVVSGTASVSQPIPIRDGDWVRKVKTNRYRYLRSDGTTVVPFTDPVYKNNNNLNSIKVEFDDPADDIAFIQVTILTADKETTDMLVHFRDCDTSGNPVVVPTGWEDYDIYADNFDEWRVARDIYEKVDGLNLFDPTTAYYAGWYNASGVFSNSFPSTGFLPAEPETWYCHSHTGNLQFAFWDDSFTFISGTTNIRAFSPANTAYVTIQLPSNTVDYYTFGVFARRDPITGTSRYRYRPIGIDDVLDVKINVFGDSNSTENGTYATEGYLALIQKDLKIPIIRNYSVSGYRFETFADDFSDYNIDADLALFNLGTNDWSFNIPLGTIADSAEQANPANYPDTLFGHMGECFHDVQDFNNETIIAFITPPQRETGYSNNSLGLTLLDYVDAIIEFCEYHSIPYFDQYRGLNLHMIRQETIDDFTVSADGIHLTDNAHSLFVYPKLKRFIQSLLT